MTTDTPIYDSVTADDGWHHSDLPEPTDWHEWFLLRVNAPVVRADGEEA